MIIKRQIAFKLRPYGKDKNLFQIQMHTTFNSQRIITSTVKGKVDFPQIGFEKGTTERGVSKVSKSC